MNFPLSRAVLSGCLTALKWMLWTTAALMLVLAVVAYLRRAEGESPLKPLALAIVLGGIGGWVCGRVARAVEGGQPDEERPG